MEKFHLPILDVGENPFTPHPEQREKELPVEFKIAKALLYQKYPLTEVGKEIQKRAKGIVDRLKNNPADQKALDELKDLKSDLPTVESPHLELFEDLQIDQEQEKEVFGIGLANVQITKGCRHQCSHCAAGAEKNVQIMPFPAVLKIARKMREQEKPNLEAWKAYYDEIGGVGKERLEEDKEFMTFLKDQFTKFESITNYYDSDPFDYRDTTFLHEDGSPADYGDVVKVLASTERRIEFTTAGYPISDSVAQRGAEKIANMGPLVEGLRVSIHPYEKGTSYSDPEVYRKNMERVIKTLEPVRPTIIFIHEPLNKSQAEQERDKDFKDRAIEPLYEIVRSLNLSTYGGLKRGVDLSRYSGRAESAEKRDNNYDNYDVMSCMPGVHILPDGSVLRQSSETDIRLGKGLRPQPIGKQLYQLNKAKG